MDYLARPIDGAHVKLIQVRWGTQARPLMRCPQCSQRFLLARTGTLETVTKTE
ncbi:hypothetical protein V3G39_09255 [Dermatophilaceae bacterium Sec6.4]